MISCKWDVLESQSLSEVKMGRGAPICERVRKKTGILKGVIGCKIHFSSCLNINRGWKCV